MRRPALLLAVLAAPLLSGCTLTFGLTGATIDNVSARQASVAYTLDDPPPMDTPVEIVTRDRQDTYGRWAGMEGAGSGSTRSVVVLQTLRGGRAELHEDQVVQIRSRPRRTHAFGPMVLTGLVIDGIIAKAIYDASQCWFGGCGDDSY